MLHNAASPAVPTPRPITGSPVDASEDLGPADEITALPADPTGVDDWMGDGLCLQTDPDLFFPERGGSTKEAKSICAECPVTATCLAWAMRTGVRHGVWGGTSESDRRRIEHTHAA